MRTVRRHPPWGLRRFFGRGVLPGFDLAGAIVKFVTLIELEATITTGVRGDKRNGEECAHASGHSYSRRRTFDPNRPREAGQGGAAKERRKEESDEPRWTPVRLEPGRFHGL
jgi:hypothetical protein